MLTKEQLKKLQPLTKHPKFGKLLKSAIRGWKNSNPQIFIMGIENQNGIFQKVVHHDNCCLMGAALLNKKITKKSVKQAYHEFENEAMIRFKLTHTTYWNLIHGFDRPDLNSKSPAKKFASKISKIVLEE